MRSPCSCANSQVFIAPHVETETYGLVTRCGRYDRSMDQGPSPPEVMQERGSQGVSGSSSEVGALNASSEGGVVVVVVGVDVGTDVETTGAVDEGAVGAVGGLTLNCEPVVTVTSAPSVVGP